jgi:hydroxypyruvate reductase
MRRDRARVRRAFFGGLRAMDIPGRVAAAIPPRLGGDVLVLAVGKAAPAMAAGALRRLHRARCVVVTTDGTPCALDRRRVHALRAGHPLPDARSVRAARRLLDAVATHEGPLVLLVSGGASALVCAPAPGVTLAQKRRVVAALLAGGASIAEVNVVRRHLSRIKGGGLLRAARGRVVTLVVSDVVGGATHDVGSGLGVPDPTSVREAARVARRYGLGALPFVETLARAPVPLRARVVASPQALARAVAARLRAQGLRARVVAPSTGSVEAAAARYARMSRALRPGHALVAAAEPTVRIAARRPGRGGRSSHLALLLAPRLAPGVVFLAGASDGVDGASGAAGAVVDATCDFPDRARALAAYDSATLHRRAGTALVTGPTGLNLADVHVLARYA